MQLLVKVRSCMLVWLLAGFACRSPPNRELPSAGSSGQPAAARDDYAAARSRFHTHLVERGPSPQPWEPVVVTPDARELPFTSGELHLTAWISADALDGAAPKRPAVLFLHGGFAFGVDDWQMSQPFRDAGYVVMTPLVRGENGQPGSFSVFYDEVDDVLAAADTLARQPGVDPNHIYVAGHSVGGTLTLLAVLASKRFRAAASLSGAPDHRSWMALQPGLAVYDAQSDDEVRMRSPLAFATGFQCPLRLYWGNREDWATEMTQSTARLAKAAGLDVDATQVDGTHMTMVKPAIALAIAFFQQHR